MGAQPMLGEIMMFGGNFAPRGWMFCDGRLLSIAQNTALFSLLGTTYGGNGQTTFALPDLRGRAPMHMGQGPGLSPRTLGEVLGEEAVTLFTSQMPAHEHRLTTSKAPSTRTGPVGNVTADTTAATALVYADGPATTPLSSSAVQSTGGSQPHENMMPYVTVNFCIAVEGVFPARN